MPIENNVTRLPREHQVAQSVQSRILYDIIARPQPQSANSFVPHILGEGRFARVFLAEQRTNGQNIRQVAIKILHNHATFNDQKLFVDEIDLLKDLSLSSRGQVINLLDIIDLSPMVMCGCGKIYQPLCPECGKHSLTRDESQDGKPCPVLCCPDKKCGYEVAGDKIERQVEYRRLITPPAKRCCTSGPRAGEGTIINFVERPALVMELAEDVLTDSNDRRWKHIVDLCLAYGVPQPQRPQQKSQAQLSQKLGRMPTEERRLSQMLVLDKMLTMLQLAEGVAWLHSKMEVVHKDLTPDNVMVQPLLQTLPAERGARRGTLSDVMSELSSYPAFEVRLIDFGLADRRQLTRSWYEESYVNRGDVNKKPYFSPEAIERVHAYRGQIPIDVEARRLTLPVELLDHDLSVMPEDTLAFEWDVNRDHDLRILKVEPVQPGHPEAGYYAEYEGNPPQMQQHRQFQLVRPLAEPHDVFSLGAIFFHLLTDDRAHAKVNQLRAFVDTLQANPCDLTPGSLLANHGKTYELHRDRLLYPDVAFRDELMVLILRAMVRGRKQSFCKSRVERNREAAQNVVDEVRRIHHAIQREVIAEPRLVQFQQMAAAASLVVLFSGLGLGLFSGHALGKRAVRAERPTLQAIEPLADSAKR